MTTSNKNNKLSTKKASLQFITPRQNTKKISFFEFCMYHGEFSLAIICHNNQELAYVCKMMNKNRVEHHDEDYTRLIKQYNFDDYNTKTQVLIRNNGGHSIGLPEGVQQEARAEKFLIGKELIIFEIDEIDWLSKQAIFTDTTNKAITLSDFWEKPWRANILCNTSSQSLFLAKMLDKFGAATWDFQHFYEKRQDIMQNASSTTCAIFGNDGSISFVNKSTQKLEDIKLKNQTFEFAEIDFLNSKKIKNKIFEK